MLQQAKKQGWGITFLLKNNFFDTRRIAITTRVLQLILQVFLQVFRITEYKRNFKKVNVSTEMQFSRW